MNQRRIDPLASEWAGLAAMAANGDHPTLAQFLKRPEIVISDLKRTISEGCGAQLTQPEWKAIETEIKYAGYLSQQERHVERMRRAESRRIPNEFHFAGIPGLSREVVEKMERVRPATLGQAGRIPGITPAAISILNVYLDMPRSEVPRG
jgi:tRNA uridine 5-carboxymethylaminomethyl modification enzyme